MFAKSESCDAPAALVGLASAFRLKSYVFSSGRVTKDKREGVISAGDTESMAANGRQSPMHFMC